MLFCCFGDSDARSDANASRSKAIAADPETRARRCQIAPVVALACDSESLRQPPRSARQSCQVSRTPYHKPSCPAHFLDTRKRLKSAKQHAASLSFRLTGNVQAVMIAVDEIHVCESRRSKQNGVAGSIAGSGVSSGILLPKIGLDFHDAAGKMRTWSPPDQHFPQKLSGYASRITPKEGAFQRTNGANWQS